MSHRRSRTIDPRFARADQRGVAALFVTVMLCFAMVLAVAVAHRNVVVEEQRSANELRAASAFEAAEAGLDWALARINDPSRIGADCLPSADAAALSFRERMVRIDVPSGDLAPRTWMDGGSAGAVAGRLRARRRRLDLPLPGGGRPVLPAVRGSAMAPAFVVELAASTRPDVVRVAGHRLHPHRCRRDLRGERRRRQRSDGAARSRVGDAAGAARRAGRGADGARRRRRRRRLARRPQRRRRERRARRFTPAAASAPTALRIGAPPGAPLGASLAGDDAAPARAVGRPLLRAHLRHGDGRLGGAAGSAPGRLRRSTAPAGSAPRSTPASAFSSSKATRRSPGPADLRQRRRPGRPRRHRRVAPVGRRRLHGVVHAASLEWNDTTPGARSSAARSSSAQLSRQRRRRSASATRPCWRGWRPAPAASCASTAAGRISNDACSPRAARPRRAEPTRRQPPRVARRLRRPRPRHAPPPRICRASSAFPATSRASDPRRSASARPRARTCSSFAAPRRRPRSDAASPPITSGDASVAAASSPAAHAPTTGSSVASTILAFDAAKSTRVAVRWPRPGRQRSAKSCSHSVHRRHRSGVRRLARARRRRDPEPRRAAPFERAPVLPLTRADPSATAAAPGSRASAAPLALAVRRPQRRRRRPLRRRRGDAATRDLSAARARPGCATGRWLLVAGTIRFTSTTPPDPAAARDAPLRDRARDRASRRRLPGAGRVLQRSEEDRALRRSTAAFASTMSPPTPTAARPGSPLGRHRRSLPRLALRRHAARRRALVGPNRPCWRRLDDRRRQHRASSLSLLPAAARRDRCEHRGLRKTSTRRRAARAQFPGHRRRRALSGRTRATEPYQP